MPAAPPVGDIAPESADGRRWEPAWQVHCLCGDMCRGFLAEGRSGLDSAGKSR